MTEVPVCTFQLPCVCCVDLKKKIVETLWPVVQKAFKLITCGGCFVVYIFYFLRCGVYFRQGMQKIQGRRSGSFHFRGKKKTPRKQTNICSSVILHHLQYLSLLGDIRGILEVRGWRLLCA